MSKSFKKKLDKLDKKKEGSPKIFKDPLTSSKTRKFRDIEDDDDDF